MESRKNKVLRVVKNIYDVKPNVMVEVYNNENECFIFKCQCLNGNYDLYDLQDKTISWGMSCDTLSDLRESLLKDFVDGLLVSLKII